MISDRIIFVESESVVVAGLFAGGAGVLIFLKNSALASKVVGIVLRDVDPTDWLFIAAGRLGFLYVLFDLHGASDGRNHRLCDPSDGSLH